MKKSIIPWRDGFPYLVIWRDSYGVQSGWQERDRGYKPSSLIIKSVGWIVSQTDTEIALSHNHADATDHTPEQDNGIMVIPTCSIIEMRELTYAYGLESELEQKRQQT